MTLNIVAAWLAFLLGTVGGAVAGLFFHRADWMGGYNSWQRRMTRLGHISFFGIGGLNLAFAMTAGSLDLTAGTAPPSILLVIGAVTMPLICYLSAFMKPFRHLFFIPVLSVATAIILTLRMLLFP